MTLDFCAYAQSLDLFRYPRTPHLEGSRLQDGDEGHDHVPYRTLAGQTLVVEEKLDGANTVLKAHVRSIRSEPSFTPYYALTGDDVSRLSYLAEIEIDDSADMQALPAGLPVQVRF